MSNTSYRERLKLFTARTGEMNRHEAAWERHLSEHCYPGDRWHEFELCFDGSAHYVPLSLSCGNETEDRMYAALDSWERCHARRCVAALEAADARGPVPLRLVREASEALQWLPESQDNGGGGTWGWDRERVRDIALGLLWSRLGLG
jgi:hypothetical protein